MKSLFERFNRTHSNLRLNEIKNEEKPGQLTICISGNIETYNSDAFRDEITMLIRHNDTITSLVFDFLNVLYISSTGVGALIKLIRITKEKRIDLFFTNINDKIQAVIKALGLAQLVKVIDEAGRFMIKIGAGVFVLGIFFHFISV